MANGADLAYLRRQKASKQANQGNGVQTLNQGQDALNGNYWLNESQAFSNPAPQQQQQVQQRNQKESGEWYEKVFGFIDELAAQFGAGFTRAWEGFADLGATALAGIGEATGWYDPTPFSEWAKQDIGGKAAEYIKTYANFTPWAIIKNTANGTYGDANYWQNAVSRFGDVFYKDEDFKTDVERYYGFNDRLETQAGQFLGGAAQSIGFMIPSIMTGGGAKAGQLVSMGLSAAGKGAEEALNDGANSGQALGYGALSGGIEVATELIPWPGGNAVAGQGLKAGKKAFVKNMVEEGLEEIISGSLDPLKKSVYKGSDAFEEWKKPSFWIGTDGNFLESVVGQGVSGAFVGGVMGASATAANVVHYGGVKQYNTVLEYQTALSANETALKQLNAGKLSVSEAQAKIDANNRFLKQYGKQMEDFANESERFKKALYGKPVDEKTYNDPKFQEQLRKMLRDGANPKSYDQYVDDFYKTQASEFRDSFSKDGMQTILDYINRNWAGTGKVRDPIIVAPKERLVYDVLDNNGNVIGQDYAKAMHEGNKIFVSEEHVDNFAGLLAHEGLIHSILDLKPNIRDGLLKEAKKIDPSALEDLERRLQNAKYEPGTDEYNSELIAHYIESQMQSIDGVMRLAQGKYNIIDILKSVFKFSKGIGYNRLMLKMANAIRAVESAKDYYALKTKAAGAMASKNIGPLPKTEREYRYGFTSAEKAEIFKQAAPFFEKEGGNILDDFAAQIGKRVYGVDLAKEDGHRYAGGYTYKEFSSEAVAKLVQEYINDRRAESQEGNRNTRPVELRSVGRGDSLRRDASGKVVQSNNREFKNNEGRVSKTSSTGRRNSINLEDLLVEDSDGEQLTKEQAEYFKDSKFVDDEGRLLRLYHGSDSAGFMRFNEYEESMGDFKPIFLTDDFERAGSYTRTINPVVTKTFANADDLLEYFNGDVATDELHLFDVDGYTYDAGRVSDDSGAVKEAKRQLGIWEGILKRSTITDEQRKLAEKRVEDFKKVVNGEDGYFLEEYDVNNEETNYFIYPTEKDLLENLIPDVQHMQNMNVNLNEENDDFEVDEKKAKTNNVYAVYANSVNPLIVNCKGNNFNWIPFEGKRMSTDEISTLAHDRGYDGVIFKNVMDNGSRDMFNDLGRANIYVAFNSNQVKAVDNYEPSTDSDIRYSRTLTPSDQFKSVDSTKELVKDTAMYIEDYLNTRGTPGEKQYQIRYTTNVNTFTDSSFSKINGVKTIEIQAKKLVRSLLDCQVRVKEGEGAYQFLGRLSDIFPEASIPTLEAVAQEIIKTTPNSEARNEATRSLEMQLDKALTQKGRNKSALSRVRVLTRLRDRVRKTIDRFTEGVNDNVKAREGLYALLDWAEQLHGAANDGFKAAGVADRVNAALEWYNEEKLAAEFPEIPYYREVRQALEDLYESLGEPKTTKDGKRVYGNLTAESMQKAIEAIRITEAAIRDMEKTSNEEIRPAVDQTIKAIQRMPYAKKVGLLSKLWRSYKRGFAPAYVVLEQMLGGNSVLAQRLIFDMQKAQSSKLIFKGMYADMLGDKLKELGIKKNFDSKTFTINGVNLTADQALGLWISLNVDLNYEAIDKSGLQYRDPKTGRLADFAGKGKAAELKTAVDSALPENYKQLGKFLLEEMNDSVKKRYMEMYDARFGKFHHRNEIGVVGDTSYWMLFRSYQMTTNMEKAVSNPAALFVHAKSRTDKSGYNKVLIAGALSSFNGYIDSLASETYIKPVYRDALRLLNAKGSGGENVTSVLKGSVDPKDMQYLNDTLSDLLGEAPYAKGSNVLNKVMSAFSVAKLSLNIGTMLKQFASIWTSNIPMSKSLKGFFSNIFRSQAVKEEYKLLIDGEKNADGSWKFEPLGGLKYRESNKGVLYANADSLGSLPGKIAEKGMIGISKVDLFTVSTGTVALMHIAQDQYGYKIGTKENAQWVKDHWSEFELSQIGNSALSKNAISRGDHGDLARAIFGFLQGANRAALGSQLHKMGLWKRNRGVKRVTLETALENAREAMQEAKDAYEADPDNAELANAYVSAQSEVMDAQAKLKDYESFKAAGGKAIPFNMAAGLLAQGVFITLINQLMRILKGKKDKDEWDITELGVEAGMATVLNWVPLFNVFQNWFGTFSKQKDGSYTFGKGYDISVPIIDLLNTFGDVVDAFKNGNGQAALRQLALLAGDMTGIPVQTLYQYAYGVTKIFNPNAADIMNSFIYPQNIGFSKVKGALEDGNEDIALRYIHTLVYDNCGEVKDTVAKEYALLANEGENALPSAIPSKYTNSKEVEVTITWTQQQKAKAVYAKANAEIEKVIASKYYKALNASQKASLIRAIYSAYKSAALHLSVPNYDGAMNRYAMLAKAGGKNIGVIMLALRYISALEDTKHKTRKEQAVSYVNQLAISKNEKLLILRMAGFSVDDSKVKSALRMYGLSKAEIEAFL